MTTCIQAAIMSGFAEWSEELKEYGFSFASIEKLEAFYWLAFESGKEAAVLAEREACAKVCIKIEISDWDSDIPMQCAEAIRARG